MDDYVAHLNFVTRVLNRRRQPRIKRYLRDGENPVESYDEVGFKQRFRLGKQTFMNLLVLFFPSDGRDNRRGLPIPPLYQLAIALRFYATGNFQIVAGDLHKLSQSTCSRVVSKVSKDISLKTSDFIKFPSTSEVLLRNRQLFYNKAQFPGVVGCIDCTHVPINSPGRAQGEIFRNRKGYFSINVQVVSGPRLEIFDIVARWPGSVHDSRIFSNSRCKLKFDEGLVQGILLGDSGYSQTSYLFTPIASPQTEAESKYNRSHSSTRNIVERLFGVWKRRFPCLSRKLQNQLPNTVNIIVACAVLHNICITSNDEHFLINDPHPEENSDAIVSSDDESSIGRGIRNAFIQRHFT